MQTKNHPMWMPRELFDQIYSRVPRLSVDLLVRTDEGVALTKRDIEPCVGQWHMPGGTVFFGEKLEDAIRRIAHDEIGSDVEIGKQVGYVEYSSLLGDGHNTWTVALVFEVKPTSAKLEGGEQGREIGMFKKMPDNLILDQAKFLATINFKP